MKYYLLMFEFIIMGEFFHVCKTKNVIRIASSHICRFHGLGNGSKKCFPDLRYKSGSVGKGAASGESTGLYRKGITEHLQRHGSRICTKSGSNLKRNSVRAGRTLESSDKRQGLEWYLRCD